MSNYPVHVSNIAATTTEKSLQDFFSFCGKIHTIELTEKEPKTATIVFETSAAAHTASLLDGGTLDGAQLKVTADSVDEEQHDDGPQPDGTPVQQHDKPKAGIVAEILAKGYKLSDDILRRAIDADKKKGISQRFLEYIKSLDTKLGEKALGPDQTISSRVQTSLNQATEQARSVDEQRGYSKTAQDFYTKAISSPFGQKVYSFYTSTSKQVWDIHEEALRISGIQRGQDAPATAPPTTPPGPSTDARADVKPAQSGV